MTGAAGGAVVAEAVGLADGAADAEGLDPEPEPLELEPLEPEPLESEPEEFDGFELVDDSVVADSLSAEPDSDGSRVDSVSTSVTVSVSISGLRAPSSFGEHAARATTSVQAVTNPANNGQARADR